MPKLSKHMREEWAVFLQPKTKRRTYNEQCRGFETKSGVFCCANYK